ncbi:hypothetical protein G169_gp31 [Pseudomonas phage AF]|uniref:hypothetical protein n=1 Tax=Pseudomonas phage AF TaxID=1235689 RepID=UPI0002970C3A|nr:hypothetical protein G169_gp31 [Pseudomonas phage AF]AFV50645.1 hypothetical protein AF_031 [Pseudomonas phage AF]
MDVRRFDFFDLGLGSENYVKCSDFDRILAERDALQQLLNARDEEVGRLRDLARKARAELLTIKAAVGFRAETLQVIGALDMALENQA